MDAQLTLPKQKRRRGGLLTAFLIVAFLVNSVAGLYFITEGHTLRLIFQPLHSWAPLLVGGLCLAALPFVVGVWKRQRWGVYGLTITMLLLTIALLLSGLPVLFGLIALVGLVLFLLLMRPLWRTPAA